MGLPEKVLGADEHVVIHTRTHVKAMLLPALAFILIAAAVGVGAAADPASRHVPSDSWRSLGLGLVLVIWLVLLPFLRWRTTTYTITNRRLITRSGILNKVGKDLPLNRINDVSHERSLMDRMLGCGIAQRADGRRGRHDRAEGCARRRACEPSDHPAALRPATRFSKPRQYRAS